MAEKVLGLPQVKIGNYVLGETLGSGTFGKVKGNALIDLIAVEVSECHDVG